jgi:hypothetical protein
MIYEENKVKIPDRYYLIMSQYKTNDSHPPGNIIVYGKDAATKKRVASVKKQNDVTSTFDNVPMYGFKITSQYNSRYDQWRIDDPRGFSTLVPLSNISYILDNSVVENGSIIGSCVWAKHSGSTPILLVVDSDAYNKATNFTKIATTTDKWNKVLPGNIVQLTNGNIGEYLGRYYTAHKNWYVRDGEDQVVYSKQKQTVLRITDYNNLTTPIEIRYGSNFRLSKIIDDSTSYDLKQAEININADLSNNDNYVIMAGNTLEKSIKYNKIPITFKNESEIKTVVQQRKTALFYELNNNGIFYEIKYTYYEQIGTVQEYLPIDANCPKLIRKPFIGRGNSYQYNPNHNFFKLEFEVETKLGNTIKTIVGNQW